MKLSKIILGERKKQDISQRWSNYKGPFKKGSEWSKIDIVTENDYEPGSIAPEDLYYSDKHGKLVAMDDIDGKYHDRIRDYLVVKKGEKVPNPMDEEKGKDRDRGVGKHNYDL